MYNINIVLISPINQLKIIRYYFKVVICRFWFYPDFMNRTYTILISSAYRLYLFMNWHILFWYRPQTVNSDYILILKSIYNRAYTILISSTYHLYLFKNQHSNSFSKKNIWFLSIHAIKSALKATNQMGISTNQTGLFMNWQVNFWSFNLWEHKEPTLRRI